MAPTDEPEEPSLETSSEESTSIEVVPETPLAESPTNPIPQVSPEPEEISSSPAPAPDETVTVPEQTAAEESAPSEEKAEAEEEGEPFADILQENKDKKRYSPNPLPPQASEEA